MFSGIIEEVGTVNKVISLNDGFRFVIQAKKVLKGTKRGDSIAVEGICLTVTDLHWTTFTVEVMNETIQRTSLRHWQVGTKVNLERALRMGDRNGGHQVSGHVDGIGTVVQQVDEGIATRITLEVDPLLTRYMIEKGSVAIDGISLTLTKVNQHQFEVSIIPHTKAYTTLMNKKVGQQVNIEVDLMGKYIEKWLGNRHE